MIAIDTNLLVYAHRAGTDEHEDAKEALASACSRPEGCGMSVASVAEFWCIATHPSSSGRPSTSDEASGFLRAMVEDGEMRIWRPGLGFESRLMLRAAELGIRGPRIFDLQIGLMAIEGGARELWTHDRGFVRLPGLRLHFPLDRPA